MGGGSMVSNEGMAFVMKTVSGKSGNVNVQKADDWNIKSNIKAYLKKKKKIELQCFLFLVFWVIRIFGQLELFRRTLEFRVIQVESSL